jgi:rod shape-determining protein MreC
MVTHRTSLFVMMVIACLFLLLDRAEADAPVFDRAREAATDAITPVLEIFSGPVAAVREFLAGIQGYLAVHEENARLREENARLLAWQAAAEQLQLTVNRYNALLNVSIDPSLEYSTGRVVADDGGPFQRTLIVNVGGRNGVERGQAAVDEHGLIGRIVGVGNEASRILLVTDINSRVPVFIEPGRHRAILTGDNSDLLRLEYLSNPDEIEGGARVVTTGEGGLIPPGLPVGVVAVNEDGVWRVRSATRFDSIDYVRVLRFSFPREIEDPGIGLPAAADRVPESEDGEAPPEPADAAETEAETEAEADTQVDEALAVPQTAEGE